MALAGALAVSLMLAAGAAGATQTFTKNDPIDIDTSPDPFPSQLEVSGVAGTVTKLTVGITDLTHQSTQDINLLLVGPGGQNVMLMSDAGGDTFSNKIDLVFDDAAAAGLPAPLASATFKPTNLGPDEFLGAPAPDPPHGTSLAPFAGVNPNGTWRLFADDEILIDDGSIQAWSLNLTTEVAEIPPLKFKLGSSPQVVKRKLKVDVDASAAGTVTFSGKVSGEVQVPAGKSTVKARLEKPAFKRLKERLENNRRVGVRVIAKLTDSTGATAEDSVRLTVKRKPR